MSSPYDDVPCPSSFMFPTISPIYPHWLTSCSRPRQKLPWPQNLRPTSTRVWIVSSCQFCASTKDGLTLMLSTEQMQSLHEHKVKVIRHSRKSISGPLTSHVLLHLIQQQPKTLTSNFAKNAARINVLESRFLARSARTEQSLHFFRVPKARFSSTSNEQDSVTSSRLSRPNRKNRLSGRHEKTVASNAWTAPASATAPRSPILLKPRPTVVIVTLALWLLHPSAGCPTRKVGLSKKKTCAR